MEFNIKRYQGGGYIAYQPLPYVPEQQPQQGSQQIAGGGEEEKAKDMGLDPEVLKKMIGEGITTDVMSYSNSVNQAYMRYSMMDDSMKNSYMGRQLRLVMKGDLGQLNMLARSKKMLDESITTSKEQDGLGEGAITQDNQAVVKQLSTGKITTMSLAQVVAERAKGDSDFKVLTNGELAQEREFNPQLMNNTNVFDVIKYAKGMDKVKEEILKNIDMIGKTSISSGTAGYGSSDNDEGLASLEAAAASGAFKIKDGKTVVSNNQQIQKAQSILWNSLSSSSQATLRMRAAQSTTDPTQIEAIARNIAADMLSPHASFMSKEIHDESYKKMSGGGAGSGKTENFGPYGAAFAGMNNNEPITIQGPNGVTIQSMSSRLPAGVARTDGKLTNLQDNTTLAKVADVRNAFTINGDKVDTRATTVTGNTHITYLPVKDGPNGVPEIDLEGAKQWAQIQQDHPGVPQQTLLAEFGSGLNLKRLVVAEGASFSSSKAGWFDNRDKNVYKAVTDGDIDSQLRDIVDPKHSFTHDFWNHPSTHLIFMPANSELDWNNADGNQAKLPASVYNMSPRNADGSFNPNYYNSGAGGANINQGAGYQTQPAPGDLTTNFFK